MLTRQARIDEVLSRSRKGAIGTNESIEYEWDYRNRLTLVRHKTGATVTKRVAYIYDVFDRRIGKKVDSDGNGQFDGHEWYAYDGDHIALAFTGLGVNSSLANRYLYGPAVDMVLAEEAVSLGGTSDFFWPAGRSPGDHPRYRQL